MAVTCVERTKNYVPKIMALAIIGKNLRAFGIDDMDFHEPLDFEEIKLPGMTDLYQVAEQLNLEFTELQRLNPEILRWFTPPGEEYPLRIPVGYLFHWKKCCEGKAQTFAATDFMEYKVRGSRTRLLHVARKFRIKRRYLSVLHRLNPSLPPHSLSQKRGRGSSSF